ncbi:Type II secretory pathway, pullulanase PulA and related glycosidase [Blautia sp. XA-2221]|uniref:Type II secretory pathway, pullulanase PulA and related glycosidase n=1 Tax=Blautia sp. XA-2221 TaxID=2903961 RepID=UPI002377FCDD|nr:Type II secretory pathway, pullulanase PulA and related glycosidase [Blautia sp. XA-2221]
MEKRDRIVIRNGNPVMLGANRNNEGMNFAVEVLPGSEASLVLYQKGSAVPSREIPFTERTGKICTLLVSGLNTKKYEYNFRIDGKIIQDPFAYGICGREQFGVPGNGEKGDQIRCTFLTEKEYDWEEDQFPDIPYRDLILYKVHVRGYTKQQKIAQKRRGTFSGLKDMIPYWKELGINAVVLMPAYEFMELPDPDGESGHMITENRNCERVNYWGYVKGFYFAPKRSYCATREPENEFRDLVKALHKAGMECMMELYFPGGTSPLTALRAAWFWRNYYHVDGFHFMGDGVPVELLAGDSILYGAKKLFQNLSVSAEDEMSAECTEAFQKDMRRYLKSDEGMLPATEYHIRHIRNAGGTVHYMASQDGFTLYDAVSYNYRHNEANGENNQDGSEYNYSWNCGIEGPTRKFAIKKMREQQIKNAFLMLLLSQGTPVIYGGDEFCNSQNGNNNAWCQDNPVGWTDWKALRKNKKIFEFVKEAIAFQKAHPVLHMEKEPKGSDYLAKGFPDISFHGERAWYLNQENTSRLLGVMYCGSYAKKEDGSEDDFIYVGYNFHWENRTIALPNLPEGMIWKKTADTSDTEEGDFFREREESYKKNIEINPRTIVVLTGKKEE